MSKNIYKGTLIICALLFMSVGCTYHLEQVIVEDVGEHIDDTAILMQIATDASYYHSQNDVWPAELSDLNEITKQRNKSLEIRKDNIIQLSVEDEGDLLIKSTHYEEDLKNLSTDDRNYSGQYVRALIESPSSNNGTYLVKILDTSVDQKEVTFEVNTSDL